MTQIRGSIAVRLFVDNAQLRLQAPGVAIGVKTKMLIWIMDGLQSNLVRAFKAGLTSNPDSLPKTSHPVSPGTKCNLFSISTLWIGPNLGPSPQDEL